MKVLLTQGFLNIAAQCHQILMPRAVKLHPSKTVTMDERDEPVRRCSLIKVGYRLFMSGF